MRLENTNSSLKVQTINMMFDNKYNFYYTLL